MKRCIAILNNYENFVNIEADRLEVNDAFITAYRGKEIAAVFDAGVANAVWISEKKPEGAS